MSAEEPGLLGASYCRETPTLSTGLQDESKEEEEIGKEHCKEANRGEDPKEPQRSSSDESEDSEPEPPPPSAVRRKVSFADAFGLDLVSVKEFDSRAENGSDVLGKHLRGEAREGEEYYFSCLFTIPSSEEDLAILLQQKKLELESIELLPGSTTIRGIIRVLNLSYHKAVYVRTTLDGWRSHFDLLAEYIPGSSDGQTDRFTFKLTLVPPFQAEGAQVEFCFRYESTAGTFWANNGGRNYLLFCHQRGGRELKEKEGDKEREAEDNNHKGKKSCLKAGRKWSNSELKSTDLRGDLSDPDSSNSESGEEKTQYDAEIRSTQAPEASCNTLADRRNKRRAARLARVQDYFSQRETELQLGSNAHAPERVLKVAIPTSHLITPERLDTSGALQEHNRMVKDTPPVLTYHQIPLLCLDWAKTTSSPAHPNAPKTCCEISPDTPEKQPEESTGESTEESTGPSTDAWKAFLNGTDHSDAHADVVDQEPLSCITLPQTHDKCDLSSPLEKVLSVWGEIRNLPESPQSNGSHQRPEETLESSAAERWKDYNPSHALEEALGYKYSEQPGINSEIHIVQESDLVCVQPGSETQDRYISSQTYFSEDEALPEINLLEPVQTLAAIESQGCHGGHGVSPEECAGSPDSTDTQEKVNKDIDEAAVNTLTFTGIRDETFTGRHIKSGGSLERRHKDEEKDPKKVKEHIRKEIENGAQMKANTSQSEYPEDLIVRLESRSHRENKEPSQSRGQSKELISVRKNVMSHEGELDAQNEWSDRDASKLQAEQVAYYEPEDEVHDETIEEIWLVPVDDSAANRECAISLTTKTEGQEKRCEVDEVIYGKKSESDVGKGFITGKESLMSHSAIDTCIFRHNQSMTSEASVDFSWTESVSEGEPVLFYGTYKSFEFVDTLRHRAAQDHQDFKAEEVECPASLSRIAAPSVDTMFAGFKAWWAKFCSLGHISKALLYTILFVIFIIAYLHDLPVCLAIYLLSVCWWCGQGRKKQVATTDSVD